MRLALIPPSDMTAEQRPLYDDMRAGISATYSAFTTIPDDGTILGPWSAWLHEPELGTAIWGVTKAPTRYRHLPEVSRQIVILVVGTHFRADYEIYAHSAVARVIHHDPRQLIDEERHTDGKNHKVLEDAKLDRVEDIVEV
jgi:4-carboxymuconolactone decarboxylase